MSKPIKSFSNYKAAKGKQWFSKVKGGKAKGTKNSAADQEVLIFIGLLEWNEKENILKPKRGKKVALRISNSAKSSLLRQKAEEKWKAYYRNLYDENQTYVLLYEDGQQVLFLPGTSEVFTLKRYHEEIGKDYNRISSDHHLLVGKLQPKLKRSVRGTVSRVKYDTNLPKDPLFL